jgi:Protein of unknown function (DUF3025)
VTGQGGRGNSPGSRADGAWPPAALPPEAPWLAPLHAPLRLAWPRLAAGVSVAQVLGDLAQPAGGPADPTVGFVAQAELPADEPYEAFIRRTGQVPTRDNLHDLFNGLVWLTQPALKHRLNALQSAEIARAGNGPHRGALRDALTLMDENGALLDAPAPLWAALRARDWRSLFITYRHVWRQARLRIVGHALLEQLTVAPRKPLTAHVLDAADPQALDAAGWAAKPFCALPVLGVPDWWPANDDAAFYDDPAVFRPRRDQTGRKPSIDR